MKKFTVNIICAFIPNDTKRRIVRNFLLRKDNVQLADIHNVPEKQNIEVIYSPEGDCVFVSGVYGTNSGRIVLDNNAYLLYRNFISAGSVIGRYSYIAEYGRIDPKVKIGRYCSIASNVLIGATKHPTKWLSTSPFQYDDWLDAKSQKKKWTISEKTIVGNDVWIGANVVIQSGVIVGDGAIIGSGAIVTKDVPPYAIVGGVPAKIIKYRFTPEIIDKLLQLKWWNLPQEEIRKLPFDNIEEIIKKMDK